LEGYDAGLDLSIISTIIGDGKMLGIYFGIGMSVVMAVIGALDFVKRKFL
jgi:hypothetical protein